ncbi:unnamed protein product (macronuclear) [Paramecium tetraurelia]|uniref:H/ACA ribonucleoprotein complex subunit n=1 Tax=Paramecium tetraurelia TaxID=5888 RepID=A0ECG9_PARTE|nr:uncharacterized protein GSPATT00003855001 [Paramecium tetraurelia]CAK92986.1 unnamed protein product [Paramecium tetraurelia]|eukprot:XP_001460383.1 hypothetical protein (macronuclear) [Paramecium tetraurelia strain d4-2]
MNDHESSDSSSDEFYEKIKAQLNIMDDEERSSRIVSRNEVLPKVAFVPPESKEQREFNFNYKNSDRIQLIGKIESLTKENIIIYSNLLEFVINLDQLIVNGQQEILGKVDDVFGKVERPHYSILLDGYVNNLVQTNQLKIGDDVFINIDSTSVLNPDAINKKGCDASNQFDEEVLNDCDVEYSDDEIEAVSKKRGNKEEGEVKKNHKKNKEKHPNQQKHDKQLPFPQQKFKAQGNNPQTQQQQQQMMQMQHSMQQQQYYQQMFLQQQMQLQMQQQQQYQQLISNQQAFPQQQMQQPQYMQQIYQQPQQLQPNPQLNLPYNTQQINQQLNQNLNSLFQNIKPQDQ